MVVRPFEEKTNNIIEIINELVLTVMISMLLHYNESNIWDTQIEDVFIYLIMSNSVLVTFILCVTLLVTITIKCCRRTKKTEVKRYMHNDTSQNVLQRKNDTSMLDFDAHRHNASVLEAPSKAGSKFAINQKF